MQFVNQKKWFYKRFARDSNLIKLGFRNLYIFPNLFGIYWILSIAVIYILGINLENEFTTGASSTSVASGTAITENGTYTFTPTSSTPRILYYRTQAAVNTGGRILIRTP